MTMNRRGFFASLAALVVAPAVPPAVPPVRDRLEKLRRGRWRVNLDELSRYREQVIADTYSAAFTASLHAARGGKGLA